MAAVPGPTLHTGKAIPWAVQASLICRSWPAPPQCHLYRGCFLHTVESLAQALFTQGSDFRSYDCKSGILDDLTFFPY